MKPNIGLYILAEDGRTPIQVEDTEKWADWFENSRTGNKTEVCGATVSTIFLGLNHAFSDSGPPILWETMIFDHDDLEGYQERYASYEDAMAGHELAVKLVEETPPNVPG